MISNSDMNQPKMCDCCTNYVYTIKQLESQIKLLKEREEVLMKCAEFYSNNDNWETSLSGQFSYILPSDMEHVDDSGFRIKGGKLARATREKLKELK